MWYIATTLYYNITELICCARGHLQLLAHAIDDYGASIEGDCFTKEREKKCRFVRADARLACLAAAKNTFRLRKREKKKKKCCMVFLMRFLLNDNGF